MLRIQKRLAVFSALSILAILLLTSSVSFARFGAADIQGTWDVELKVRYTNVNDVGDPASAVFNDTATMKITQFLAVGGNGSVINITIDGTANPIIDGSTPTPDFFGRGVVTPVAAGFGAGNDHMVAIHCPSDVDYGQQIIVHKIYRSRPDMGFTRMKGTWVIVDNRAGSADGMIATFTAERLDRDDPGVSTCP